MYGILSISKLKFIQLNIMFLSIQLNLMFFALLEQTKDPSLYGILSISKLKFIQLIIMVSLFWSRQDRFIRRFIDVLCDVKVTDEIRSVWISYWSQVCSMYYLQLKKVNSLVILYNLVCSQN